MKSPAVVWKTQSKSCGAFFVSFEGVSRTFGGPLDDDPPPQPARATSSANSGMARRIGPQGNGRDTLAAMALLAIVTALAQTGFAFGRTGGNIMPFTISIATTGRVTATGAAPAHASMVSKLRLANLNSAVLDAQFETMPLVTNCKGTLPDIASQVVRVGGRTVRVHGGCVARFNRLWTAMNRAVRT